MNIYDHFISDCVLISNSNSYITGDIYIIKAFEKYCDNSFVNSTELNIMNYLKQNYPSKFYNNYLYMILFPIDEKTYFLID